jgi:hypothetical protein
LSDDLGQTFTMDNKQLSDDLGQTFRTDNKQLSDDLGQTFTMDNKQLSDDLGQTFRTDNKQLSDDLGQTFTMDNKQLSDDLGQTFTMDNKQLSDDLGQTFTTDNKHLSDDLGQTFTDNKRMIDDFDQTFMDNKHISHTLSAWEGKFYSSDELDQTFMVMDNKQVIDATFSAWEGKINNSDELDPTFMDKKNTIEKFRVWEGENSSSGQHDPTFMVMDNKSVIDTPFSAWEGKINNSDELDPTFMDKKNTIETFSVWEGENNRSDEHEPTFMENKQVINDANNTYTRGELHQTGGAYSDTNFISEESELESDSTSVTDIDDADSNYVPTDESEMEIKKKATIEYENDAGPKHRTRSVSHRIEKNCEFNVNDETPVTSSMLMKRETLAELKTQLILLSSSQIAEEDCLLKRIHKLALISENEDFEIIVSAFASEVFLELQRCVRVYLYGNAIESLI